MGWISLQPLDIFESTLPIPTRHDHFGASPQQKDDVPVLESISYAFGSTRQEALRLLPCIRLALGSGTRRVRPRFVDVEVPIAPLPSHVDPKRISLRRGSALGDGDRIDERHRASASCQHQLRSSPPRARSEKAVSDRLEMRLDGLPSLQLTIRCGRKRRENVRHRIAIHDEPSIDVGEHVGWRQPRSAEEENPLIRDPRVFANSHGPTRRDGTCCHRYRESGQGERHVKATFRHHGNGTGSVLMTCSGAVADGNHCPRGQWMVRGSRDRDLVRLASRPTAMPVNVKRASRGRTREALSSVVRGYVKLRPCPCPWSSRTRSCRRRRTRRGTT